MLCLTGCSAAGAAGGNQNTAEGQEATNNPNPLYLPMVKKGKSATIHVNLTGFNSLKCPLDSDSNQLSTLAEIHSALNVKTLGNDAQNFPGKAVFWLKEDGVDRPVYRDFTADYWSPQANNEGFISAHPSAKISDQQKTEWPQTEMRISIPLGDDQDAGALDPHMVEPPTAKMSCEYSRTSPVLTKGEDGFPSVPYIKEENNTLSCTVPQLGEPGSTLAVVEFSGIYFTLGEGSGDVPLNIEVTDENGEVSTYETQASAGYAPWPRNEKGALKSWTMRPRLNWLLPWEAQRIIGDFKKLVVNTIDPQCDYTKSLGSSISVTPST